MKKIVFLIFSLLLSIQLIGQQGMGQWYMYFSPNIVRDVVYNKSEESIFAIYEKGMIDYDLATGEQTKWSAADYLSDVSPSSIAYDEGSASIIIGYENGNVDFIHRNRVTNLGAIKQSNKNGSKTINHIMLKDGFAYLSTGLGIIVINIHKKEVKDTYQPSNEDVEILSTTILDGKLYALTKETVFRADLNNAFLSDPNQWEKIDFIPDYSGAGRYKHLVAQHDQLFLSFQHDTLGNSDSLFRIKNDELEVIYTGIVRSLKADHDLLLLSTYSAVLGYDSSLNQEINLFQYQGGYSILPNNACYADGYYFIADHQSGLMRLKDPYNSQSISFPGPRYNTAFRAKWRDKKFAIATGGYQGKTPAFRKNGGAVSYDGEWKAVTVDGSPFLDGNRMWDFISTAIHPKTDVVAFGTNSTMPLILTEKGKVIDTFSFHNSLIEEYGNVGWGEITDLEYDDQGNLWIANSKSINPLKVLTKNGEWFEFDLGSTVNGRTTTRLVIDRNGVKWMGVEGVGIVAFDEGSTVANTNENRYKVFKIGINNGDLPSSTVGAIAVDFDNNIWIGTPEGMRVLYNTSNIFEAGPGEYDFQKLIIEYNGIPEPVLGYTHINDIMIDGGNRKWIGTASAGAILLSPDGLNVEKEFSKDNSPLLSDNIYDIAIDHSTGIVHFITEEGMISYRSNASQGDQEYVNVKVFPNPVRPNYYGPITMQGIAYDSDVKITDVSGRLVYRTHSNGGTATWDGNTLNGERAKTGVYLIWTSIDDEDFKGKKVGKVVFIN